MQPEPPNFLRSCQCARQVEARLVGYRAMSSIFKLSAAPALLAALSLSATPAAAADLPAPQVHSAVEVLPAWTPGDDTADQYRHYRHRRDRGVDAGDVLAGILIIGGIAAVANAAKNSQPRSYPDRDYRYPDQRRGDDRQQYDPRGLDRAVQMCADEVERDVRISSIDTVNRTGQGWQITGSLYNGSGFTCSIGEDGRIEAIDYGRGGGPAYESGEVRDQGGYDDQGSYDRQGADDDGTDDDGYVSAEPATDRQYEATTYSQARARIDNQAPAYPGGPVAGEVEDAPDIEFGTGYQGVEG